jgi:catechol 2,3-dioxygenase-like lactoylglutathione lyase family enzyme
MIIGTHALMFADDADAARAFLRDVLGLAHVDVHDGWLIFRLPPAELGVHPSAPAGPPSGHHELWLVCDDIDATVRELAAKGVETEPVVEQGFGRVTSLQVPGAGPLSLYQPSHPTAFDLV